MLNEYFSPMVHIQVCVGVHITSWDHPNLSAPHWRLYYNSGSSSAVHFRGQTYELNPKRWMLISPNTAFSTSTKETIDHLFIHFTARTPYEQVKPEIFVFPTSRENQARLVELYGLSVEWPSPSGRGEVVALGLICEALSLIPEDRLARPMDPRILEAINLAHQDFANMEDNKALAQKVGMSENSFIRLFKSQTGASPQSYFTIKRIELASDLLHRTKASIQQIATDTGFCDRYHFSRVFKKVRGQSPAQFRDQSSILSDFRLQTRDSHE